MNLSPCQVCKTAHVKRMNAPLCLPPLQLLCEINLPFKAGMVVHIYSRHQVTTHATFRKLHMIKCSFICIMYVLFCVHVCCFCVLLCIGSYMLIHMWKQRDKKLKSASAGAVKEGKSKEKETKQE